MHDVITQQGKDILAQNSNFVSIQRGISNMTLD
jgi:hypothetical protein